MKKRKPQIVWMVKTSSGRLIAWSAQDAKQYAISEFIKTRTTNGSWDYWKAEGYSVVRVELREVRGAK